MHVEDTLTRLSEQVRSGAVWSVVFWSVWVSCRVVVSHIRCQIWVLRQIREEKLISAVTNTYAPALEVVTR